MIEEDTLLFGQVQTYQVYSDGSSPLKASIAWLDPIGTPGPIAVNDPGIMLVNDLDLRIISPSDTTFPWKLDGANPNQPATKGDNIVDNVEVVEISNPTPGIYTVQISHKGLLTGSQQTYGLVVDGIKTPDSLLFCQPLHEFNSYYGDFSDGSGVADYQNNQTCSWRISTTGFAKIELYFNSIDLENNADFVNVYDGPDNTSPLLGSFTGNTIPAMVRSTSATMFVTFTRDINNAGNKGL